MSSGLVGLAVVAFSCAEQTTPKQTVDAKGLTFEAPASWKSSPPPGRCAGRELKVEPIEGDDYPGRAGGLRLPGRRRLGGSQSRALAEPVQGQGRQPPKIETKKVKGKNVEVTRAETPATIIPPSSPDGRPEPDRRRCPAAGRDRHDRRGQLRTSGWSAPTRR